MAEVAGKPRQRKRRVIVVDDSEDTAQSLRWLLEAAGCEVRTLSGGEAVAYEVSRFRPHVIFLDLALGTGPSGLDVARQLRARERSGGRPLIAVVSGWTRDSDRVAARAAGCDLFFTKGSEPQNLVEVALHGDRRKALHGTPPDGVERRGRT